MSSLSQKEVRRFSIGRVTAFSFFLFLIVVFLIGFSFFESKARDTKRVADLKTIEKALDIYYDQFHKYPDNKDLDWAGWDSSFEPQGEKELFIPQLLSQGILKKTVKDPLNDATYYYRYKKFTSGSHGCDKSFVILQAVNFENTTKDHGSGSCPKKNWTDELSNGYTIQKFE